MIKGVGEVQDGRGHRKLLILGLADHDVSVLLGGAILSVECADVGLPPMRVDVMYGEDEAAIRRRLQPVLAAPPDSDGGRPA